MANTQKTIFAGTLTVVVTNTTYTTPEGAGEIFMKNTGIADAQFKGSAGDSEFVTLAKGESFSYGYIDSVRLPITIDATGTVVQVSISI